MDGTFIPPPPPSPSQHSNSPQIYHNRTNNLKHHQPHQYHQHAHSAHVYVNDKPFLPPSPQSKQEIDKHESWKRKRRNTDTERAKKAQILQLKKEQERSYTNAVNPHQNRYNNHGEQYQLSQHHYHQHAQSMHSPNQYQTNNEYKGRQNEEKECFCGKKMFVCQNIHDRDCKGCNTNIKKDDNLYFCKHHRHYLCADCVEYAMNECNQEPIDDKHCTEQLYFIYNNNQLIKQPLSQREIISLFVHKQLKEDKLYVMVAHHAAHDDAKWEKLTFPEEIANNMKKYEHIAGTKAIEKCAIVNQEFKKHYCKLYNNLIENPITGRIRQIQEPEEMPEEELQTNLLKSRILRRLLGKIIAVALTINIILHCVPTLILSSIFLCIFFCVFCCFQDKIDEAVDGELLRIIFVFFLYSGMAITPLVNVYIALNVTETWNEIQSWMISYMVWGIVSLITSISHFVLIYAHKDIRILDNTVLVIMGVDFGDFDVVRELKGKNRFEMFGIIFIFPSLASLLPAAIVGFIANFYLEEKFDLKCGGFRDVTEGVDAEHLCFEEPYGCCQMISSHDILNMYVFVGGLASNILAAWAIIRITGYLLVNGFPKLSLFARQSK